MKVLTQPEMARDFMVGMRRGARYGYGFDEIALVPGSVTIDPADVDTGVNDGAFKTQIPVFASAMDSVVNPAFAIAAHRAGMIAVLNLLGLQTRYEDPEDALERIRSADDSEATRVIQEVYREPVQPEFIKRRIREIKDGGAPAYVSLTPGRVEEFLQTVLDAPADVLVVQSTVTSPRYESRRSPGLNLADLIRRISIPVIVGNCVTYEVARELMEAGAAAVLVGIGPGAACTTRVVTGVGVPQVTATIDCAAARDDYYAETGRYVPIITDGGMRTGGDVTKALAAGADFVMLGSPFARATEAPGRGFHWGMATSDPALPRGTRVRIPTTYPLQKILFGPSETDDGSLNLMGGLRSAMGLLGAHNLRELREVEIIVAPAIVSEGKYYQFRKAS
ncbi:MAG: GuaB3 family IMP dehydrogenase-related protein [bacterium JZ-2024 1]